MVDEWRCPQCGNVQSSQMRFCTQCGTQKPDSVTDTIVSARTAGAAPATVTAQTGFNRREMMLAGVVAVLLLLLCGVLAALGLFVWQRSGSEETAGNETASPTIVVTPTGAKTELPPPATNTPTVIVDTPVTVTAALDAAVAPEPDSNDDTIRSEPILGVLNFAADVTADLEPTEATDNFEAGIKKVHVVFSYENMTPGESWERVWYLDDKEMLHSAEPWDGDENGVFDYFLEAGGQPLPPGEWRLELYIRDELAASGSFSIAESATPTPTRTSHPTETPSPTPTATPPPRTTGGGGGGVYALAYTRWDGAFHNLYISDTNGSSDRLIVKRAAGPSWSPDGKRLFFFGEQGVNQQFAPDGRVDCEFNTISGGIVALDIPPGNSDICAVHYGPWLCERKSIDVQSPPSDVCEQDGYKVFQNLDWKEGSARWANVASDGSAVAYDAKPGGGYRIYFRSILNSAQYHFEIIGEQADWSPDSQRLVYRSGRDNVQGIWISNRDDTGHLNFTVNGTDSFPTWSANGRAIAFTRDSGGGNLDIYVMNVDGSNVQRLTDAPGHDILPSFTPGGDIIFRSDRSGSWGIWKMSGSGGNQRELIPNADVGPDWAMSRMDVR